MAGEKLSAATWSKAFTAQGSSASGFLLVSLVGSLLTQGVFHAPTLCMRHQVPCWAVVTPVSRCSPSLGAFAVTGFSHSVAASLAAKCNLVLHAGIISSALS